MTFNYVLMNPPYKATLHLDVISSILEPTIKCDTCVNLSPIRWLQDPLSKHKKGTSDFDKYEESVSKHLKGLEVIPTECANATFSRPILLQPLGIYTLNSIGGLDYKSFNQNSILEKVINKNTFQSLSVVNYNDSLENYVCLNTMAPSMKYGKPYFETLKNFGYFIKGKNSSGYNYREAKAHCKEATRGDVSNTLCAVFDTDKEAINCWNAFNTDFCKYCISKSVVDIHVYQKFLPWVNDIINPRTGLIGYKSDWVDDDFYKVFDLTDQEIKSICL